jgi:hypothetical protein
MKTSSSSALVFCVLFFSFSESFGLTKQIEIPFGDKIETCLSNEDIWDDLSSALLNSEDSRLWPNAKSNVRGDGLVENGLIAVKYKINFFYRPVFKYFISDVVAYRSFSYTATEEHPFTGGAHLEIHDNGIRRKLIWQGVYHPKNESSLARDIFKNYSQDFFAELRKHFRHLEAEVCTN